MLLGGLQKEFPKRKDPVIGSGLSFYGTWFESSGVDHTPRTRYDSKYNLSSSTIIRPGGLGRGRLRPLGRRPFKKRPLRGLS